MNIVNYVGFYISVIFLLIGVIISIPFLTLYERKLLSYIQNRKGPKKVSILGILQPIFDGVKLLIKENSFPSNSKIVLFWFSPLLNFLVMVYLWVFFPFFYKWSSFQLGFVVLLCFLRVKIYTLISSGWSRNSKYRLFGRVRGACQVISYEVSLIFIILFPRIFLGGFKLWMFFDKSLFFLVFTLNLFIIWLIVILAETKRSPFDFAEGESELVSGFNTEYSSLVFAFLFLGEYGSILFISCLTSLLFLFCKINLYILLGLLVTVFVVWSRGTLPRFRYDFLMVLAWKVVLPICLFSIFFFFLLV